MATYDNDHLSNSMVSLSVDDDRWKELELDESIRTQLNQIENDYDSIFSWDIRRLTGIHQNLLIKLIDKIREDLDFIVDNNDEFNLNRFYLQLLACYELYNTKSYKESYLEIESVVKFMNTCKFEESDEQYLEAYHHIAQSTYAYVALTLKIDSKKLFKEVKQIKSFNQAEKAAIFAVKAMVFMQYPPKGNDIALQFADQARSLDSTEPQWIIVWLKAKGRERRYYNQSKLPDEDEMNAAEMLCSTRTKPNHLIVAADLFKEAATLNKFKDIEKSNTLFRLSSDIIKESVELAKGDTKLLYSCLLICIGYPEQFFSKSMINNVIETLSKVKNSHVDYVLGKYYLNNEKDYEKAKILLTRGMAAGNFGSSLLLLRLECMLKSVYEYPFVQSLNMMYNVFISPKRRLIILTQILMYYTYCEDNPKEIMHYLKLYIDQDIDDAFKTRCLIFGYSLFKIDDPRSKQFLNDLYLKVKNSLNHKWSIEEKKIIDNTFDRFDKISKIKIYNGLFNDEYKKIEVNSNRKYPYNKPYDNSKRESWRKQKVDLSDNESNKSQQHQSTSKSINETKTLEKQFSLDREPLTAQHKFIDNNIKLPVRQSIESKATLNDSNSIEPKLKKFENKFSSSGNVHVVSFENSINRPYSSRMRGRGIDRHGYNKPSWRNQQDDPQNTDNTFKILKNPDIKYVEASSNEDYLKNKRGRNPRGEHGNRTLYSGSSWRKDDDDFES